MKIVALSKKYVHEILRVLTFLMALIILVLGVLNFTQNQDSTASELRSIKSLTEQIKTLENQNQTLLNQLKTGNNSIHNQINCIVNFFTQPPMARNNTVISKPNPCIIKTVSFDGAPVGSASRGIKSA